MSTEEIIAGIKASIIAIEAFWDLDGATQERTLNMAYKCMRAVLMMFGGKEE